MSVNALAGFYFISTLGVICIVPTLPTCVNALSGFYSIVTVSLQKPRFYTAFRAYFCRYLSEFSDNSLFLCMFIIWTYFQGSFAFYFCLEYSIKSRLCHQLLLNFPCKFALPPGTLIQPPFLSPWSSNALSGLCHWDTNPATVPVPPVHCMKKRLPKKH